jgi:hypothetical protein
MAHNLSVRINKETKDILEQLSQKTGSSMTAVLHDAVKEFQKKKFWEDVNRAYNTMRKDPEASSSYDEESKLLEGTIADGLEDGGLD